MKHKITLIFVGFVINQQKFPCQETNLFSPQIPIDIPKCLHALFGDASGLGFRKAELRMFLSLLLMTIGTFTKSSKYPEFSSLS